jgi:hypothetical protein
LYSERLMNEILRVKSDLDKAFVRLTMSARFTTVPF